MTTRSAGPTAAFRWLRNAVNLGHGNAKAVFGGAALVLVASLVPSLLTLPIQLGMGPGPDTLAIVLAVSFVFGLLLVPVLGGFMRVIDAAERGLPAKATDVFGPYRAGEAMRFVGFGLAMMLVYCAVLALIAAVAGTEVFDWYWKTATAPQATAPASALNDLPEGFRTAFALAGVLGLFVGGIYAIGLGQVALGRRPVGDAMRDGAVGTLKNLLPLLLMALVAMLAMIVLLIGFGLVVMLAAVLAKLAGEWAMLVVLLPLYLGLILVLMVVMFGVMYHLWRDVCGDAPVAGAVDHSVEA